MGLFWKKVEKKSVIFRRDFFQPLAKGKKIEYF